MRHASGPLIHHDLIVHQAGNTGGTAIEEINGRDDLPPRILVGCRERGRR
jgi:hypothetical protein